MNFAVADSIHKNAALMSTQVRAGPNVPIANLCPVPGNLMSFGIDPPSAKSHESSIARSQKHIYTNTLKLLSKSVVKILAEKGIAADANMGNIDDFWAHSESQLLNCDVDILVPSSSIGIFDPADYRFICETCNANNITPGNLRKLREKAETMLTKITKHVAEISAACHTEDGKFNYILDPKWATDQQHDKIKMAAVTAAGHGSGTDPLFTQPSVMEPLSEHQTAVLQSALEDKARQRFRMAGATEKHWDQKTEMLLKSWDPKNKRFSRVVSDPVSVLYLCAFDAASGGFKLDGVMANFRAQCFKEVLSIPLFEQTMLNHFNYLESANKDQTRQWLRDSLLRSKDSEGKCFDDVEDWYYAVDRASAYQAHMPDLYKWAKAEWHLQAHHSKLLKKFTKGEHYDEGMEWVVICDMYILMIAKKVRYTWSSMNDVIITRAPVVAAITKHVMNAIDNWPETQKFLRCVLQHIRPSFLTMPSHNMLKMLSGRAEVRARAEWQNSGAYMKYIEHTHAALTAIDCLNAETHNCFVAYNMKVEDFLCMIPSTQNSIPKNDRDNGIIDHHLTSLQLQYKKGFQEAMSFAYHCEKNDLSNWYHKNLEGLGKVHHVLRPILVNALLLILDDLTQQSTTHRELDDQYFSSDGPFRSLTAYTSNVASCNAELERIVASKRISSKYVVDFISIVEDAHNIVHIINEAKHAAGDNNLDKNQIQWPDTKVIGIVLSRLQRYATPEEKVLDALRDMGQVANDIYNDYRDLFHTYNHEMKDVMAFYSARDNAVMILLARCLIPFLANLPHDAVASSNLPVARLQNDLWDTGPHQRLVQRLQMILDYGQKVHGISKEDAELYMTDHRSLIESMMQQNFASTMPEHITTLNTKAFVTIVQTLYCAGIHSNGAHSIAAYREERTRGFTPEQMESKQAYFRSQAIGIVGTLQSEFIKRRECNTGNCDPNDCGAIAAGYWRQYCCSKAIQDLGENVPMTDGIRDRVKSVIEALVSDTMPRRNRSGFIGRWKKQQHTLGGNMVIDDENTGFGKTRRDKTAFGQPQKTRQSLEDRVKVLFAIMKDKEFLAIMSARRWRLAEQMYSIGLPKELPKEELSEKTLSDMVTLIRRPKENETYKTICKALEGCTLHPNDSIQFENWKSVWSSIENFGKALFSLSYVSAAYFLNFIDGFIQSNNAAFAQITNNCNYVVQNPTLIQEDLALGLITHTCTIGYKCAIDLYHKFGYNGIHFGHAAVRGPQLDPSLKDILPSFVRNAVESIHFIPKGQIKPQEAASALSGFKSSSFNADGSSGEKIIMDHFVGHVALHRNLYAHNLKLWGLMIANIGPMCSYYAGETKAYISLLIELLLYGMYETLLLRQTNPMHQTEMPWKDKHLPGDDSGSTSALKPGHLFGVAGAELDRTIQLDRTILPPLTAETPTQRMLPEIDYSTPYLEPNRSWVRVSDSASIGDSEVYAEQDDDDSDQENAFPHDANGYWPVASIPYPSHLRKRAKAEDYWKRTGEDISKRSANYQKQKQEENKSEFELPKVDEKASRNMFLFDYAKGLVRDFVTGLKNGILESTAALKPPANKHAQDFATCISECLKSSLAVRSNQRKFSDLYEQLQSVRFDNTLQEYIQALFCSHSPSIPHNYWSEWYNTSCNSFHDMLTSMINNDFDHDMNIGAKKAFKKGQLIPGFKISILSEENLRTLEMVQRQDCTPEVRQALNEQFNKIPEWKLERGKRELAMLEIDCGHITTYLRTNKDNILFEIEAPEARAVAYRLVHHKDPTPEKRREWYRHKKDRYVEKKPERNVLTDLTRQLLNINESTAQVVQAMVLAAKELNVWDGDLREHKDVLRKAEKWTRKQHKEASEQAKLYRDIITQYERLYREDRLKAREQMAAKATAEASSETMRQYARKLQSLGYSRATAREL